jgi:glycine/D-amino acid oxidase-like deaminating enzyme
LSLWLRGYCIFTKKPKASNYYICTMQVDYLIIGQGLCGTWLSYYLQKAGRSFVIIDQPQPFSASALAAGIVNPVTGRRIVKTWMIDELLPYVQQRYQEIGNSLQIECISQRNIIDFFPTPQMKLAFDERFAADTGYLSRPADQNQWYTHFNYDFGVGEIQPCYLVNLSLLLPQYRKQLEQRHQIRSELFDVEQLSLTNTSIRYQDIEADKIIFCDGTGGNSNPYFKNLPFAPNKGEILLVQIPGLPATKIYKKGINLVPWKEDVFWMGSSYEWAFTDAQPSDLFRKKSEIVLKEWLRIPFTIIDHLAAVRPATLERRPFAGLHPQYPQIGILNGMGTKGCSLAPYFAEQMVNHLLDGQPLHPEASISRFKRILGRSD